MTLASGLLGALVGLVLGLTGAGGGALAVPILIGPLEWPVAQAAPVALLAVGCAAALGSAAPLRRGEVHRQSVAWLALSGLLGGPLALRAAAHVSRQAIAFGFLAVALWLTWRAWKPSAGDPVRPPTGPARPPVLVAIGLSSGLVGGFLGIGGGFVLVPALARWGGCASWQQAITTSLAVIAIVSLATWASSLPASLSLPAGGIWFVAAAAAGLFAGRLWSARWPAGFAQRAFTALLLAASLAACLI